jgi:hypothetical protein
MDFALLRQGVQILQIRFSILHSDVLYICHRFLQSKVFSARMAKQSDVEMIREFLEKTNVDSLVAVHLNDSLSSEICNLI